MATVYFKITPQQEKEVKALMSGEGYTSKAEFFRFLVKYYKYQKLAEKKELEKEAEELGALLQRLNREGKLKHNLEEALDEL